MRAATASRDEKLISQIRAGDTESFNVLVKEYLPQTYKKVRGLVPDQDAEDVTQEIFLNLVCSIDKFESRSSFATWFDKIVVNRVADYHRKNFRYKSRFVHSEVTPREEPPLQSEGGIEIDEILIQLPKPYREVLSLKFCQDLSFKEIAASLGMNYEAVRSRYRRGIKCAASKIEPSLALTS
jgi:RNA polymerase sigma-70 factor (ECF subfamily)